MSVEPGTVRIRAAGDGDIEAIDALWRACGLWRPWNDPRKDIAFCRASADAELFVAEAEGALAGTVMCGHDGHRGWLYYLAVDPSRQRQGLGRQLVRHAEGWLHRRGAPKAQLMIRTGNRAVEKFYEALGYEVSGVFVMERFLDPAAATARQKARDEAAPPAPEPGQIEVVTTYLEMREAPTRSRVAPPPGTALLKLEEPSVAFYRFLYETVGGPWLWYERRQMDDDALRDIIADPEVDIYVLYAGGEPAGYAELDRRSRGEIELAYLGLRPDQVGKGLGIFLLSAAVESAWRHGPDRLWVHTCNLDHPRALGLYQRVGFSVCDQERTIIDDPRATGWFPDPKNTGDPAQTSG
ncbi:MAG: GNAT family acetyltransferase [Bauldia litoralis]